MKRKYIFFAIVFLFASLNLVSQIKIKGVIEDENSGEILAGASIYEPISKSGTIAELDGSFELVLDNEADITISFTGYRPRKIKVASSVDLGKIKMKTADVGLTDLVVSSSIAVQRKTPVAISSLSAEDIELKLGNQEYPEVLKSTPSVYATKAGGGYGDSRVNIRGFSSQNVAVMINGVPMNDMEWGGVYWSNWAGLSDVTRTMQVQRGLGASRIAVPSVGGSINIITKASEASKGGTAYMGLGNDGYEKASFSFSTGLSEDGWSFTALGAKTTGDGYIQGTSFEGYSAFLSLAKRFNDEHQLSLTAFMSPQTHQQRRDALKITEWQKYGYKYNAGFGYDNNGQERMFNYNYYNKPQISFNHFFQISSQTTLSSAAYLSIGKGGGYSGVGNNQNYAYGSTGGYVNDYYRKSDGSFDYAAVIAENENNINGSQLAMKSSTNDHVWYGLLSTLNVQGKNIQWQVGVDLRQYKGIHQAFIVDLLGGDFLVDPARKTSKYQSDPLLMNKKLSVGDLVYRDYDGYVSQGGIFGQVEYNKNDLSTFIAGSVSTTSYLRVDRFYYDNVASDRISKPGFMFKGGANFNIDRNHAIFSNIGYFSRAPYFSGGIFISSTTSNNVNTQAQNEKIFSAELGYGYRSRNLTANVNIYHTQWMDKTMIRAINSSDPSQGTINLSGVNSLHQGLEFDLRYKPLKKLELRTMLSMGDWIWNSNAEGWVFNAEGQPVNTRGEVVEAFSDTHAFTKVNIQGVKVGNSAQTTAFAEIRYEFIKGLRLGADYTYYATNYADFSMSISNWGENNFEQSWKIPNSGVMDLFGDYRFKISGLNATFYGRVNNLLNTIYIADATDLGTTHTWEGVSVYYGFQRTWSVGLKLYF